MPKLDFQGFGYKDNVWLRCGSCRVRFLKGRFPYMFSDSFSEYCSRLEVKRKPRMG